MTSRKTPDTINTLELPQDLEREQVGKLNEQERPASKEIIFSDKIVTSLITDINRRTAQHQTLVSVKEEKEKEDRERLLDSMQSGFKQDLECFLASLQNVFEREKFPKEAIKSTTDRIIENLVNFAENHEVGNPIAIVDRYFFNISPDHEVYLKLLIDAYRRCLVEPDQNTAYTIIKEGLKKEVASSHVRESTMGGIRKNFYDKFETYWNLGSLTDRSREKNGMPLELKKIIANSLEVIKGKQFEIEAKKYVKTKKLSRWEWLNLSTTYMVDELEKAMDIWEDSNESNFRIRRSDLVEIVFSLLRQHRSSLVASQGDVDINFVRTAWHYRDLSPKDVVKQILGLHSPMVNLPNEKASEKLLTEQASYSAYLNDLEKECLSIAAMFFKEQVGLIVPQNYKERLSPHEHFMYKSTTSTERGELTKDEIDILMRDNLDKCLTHIIREIDSEESFLLNRAAVAKLATFHKIVLALSYKGEKAQLATDALISKFDRYPYWLRLLDDGEHTDGGVRVYDFAAIPGAKLHVANPKGLLSVIRKLLLKGEDSGGMAQDVVRDAVRFSIVLPNREWKDLSSEEDRIDRVLKVLRMITVIFGSDFHVARTKLMLAPGSKSNVFSSGDRLSAQFTFINKYLNSLEGNRPDASPIEMQIIGELDAPGASSAMQERNTYESNQHEKVIKTLGIETDFSDYVIALTSFLEEQQLDEEKFGSLELIRDNSVKEKVLHLMKIFASKCPSLRVKLLERMYNSPPIYVLFKDGLIFKFRQFKGAAPDLAEAAIKSLTDLLAMPILTLRYPSISLVKGVGSEEKGAPKQLKEIPFNS